MVRFDLVSILTIGIYVQFRSRPRGLIFWSIYVFFGKKDDQKCLWTCKLASGQTSKIMLANVDNLCTVCLQGKGDGQILVLPISEWHTQIAEIGSRIHESSQYPIVRIF